ncbi:hypothetical protein [Inmirania thermothiophila]|uniref:Uncharacterized protein n=1 Tax=Inmirania thermothiophila TaxID=1750597 RepID=A0A3N1XU03_9GAMM|nr:hypothetical protein [Inmirania thermothiophila]ROR29651.1 hypothetical protein EDC57_2322 [Inmirania thermothiophila]
MAVAEEPQGEDGVVITPMEWLLDDKRPEGYQPTTDIRLKAEARGVRYREAVPEPVRREWSLLLRKAKTRGLTAREARRIARLSVSINEHLEAAMARLGSDGGDAG